MLINLRRTLGKSSTTFITYTSQIYQHLLVEFFYDICEIFSNIHQTINGLLCHKVQGYTHKQRIKPDTSKARL